MNACSFILVALCGVVMAQYVREPQFNTNIFDSCKSSTNLTDEDVIVFKKLKFDDLSAQQKEFMHCYVRKANMVNDANEILVDKIPFSTAEKRQSCKTKVGKFLTNDHILAFAMCITDKKHLAVCDVIKNIE